MKSRRAFLRSIGVSSLGLGVGQGSAWPVDGRRGHRYEPHAGPGQSPIRQPGSDADGAPARPRRPPECYVDVTAHGAAGDGSTDDRPAIQSAIDSLPAEGGIVCFPSGTYKVAKAPGSPYAIRVPASGQVRLEGCGAVLASAVRGDAGDDGACTLAYQGAGESHGLCVRGLRFYGYEAGPDCDGIWTNGKASLVSITDCTIEGFRHGIVGTDWSGASRELLPHTYVERCNVVRNTDTAIVISSTDAMVVARCRIKDNGGAGLEIGQAGDRSFAGRALSGITNDFLIEGCLVERNRTGLLLVEAREGVVQACDFESNDEGHAGAYHLDCTGTGTSGAGSRSVRISGCFFSGEPRNGNVKARSGTRLMGNTHKNGDPAICNTSASEPVAAPFEVFQTGNVTTMFEAPAGTGILTDLAPMTYQLSGETVAPGDETLQVSPSFGLDDQSLLVVSAGLEDGGARSGDRYRWVLRPASDPDGPTLPLHAGASAYGKIRNNSSMRFVRCVRKEDVPEHTAGTRYSLFARNATRRPVDLFGWISVHVLDRGRG